MTMRKNFLIKAVCFTQIIILLLCAAGCAARNNESTYRDSGKAEEIISDATTSETEATTAPTIAETIPEEPDATIVTTTPEPTTEPVETRPQETNPTETPPAVEVKPTDPPATEPAHTHSYSSNITYPTCTSEGYTQHKCSCGNSYNDARTPSLGHDYTDKVIAPTTENQGYTEHVCGRCGHSYKDSYIDKLPVQEPSEPAVCQHNWEMKYYPEQGHYGEVYILCKCGARFKTPDEWNAHVKANLSEAVEKHTSWTSNKDYIIDSPERYEWICSSCGAVSSTQP